MSCFDTLENLLPRFERYYNITKFQNQDFYALAEFHATNQQYFLVKAAQISSESSNEYVFFASHKELSESKLLELCNKAWETGLSMVNPHSGHKNSDISLILVTDKAENSIKNLSKKIKFYKSYKHSFWGWSNFKLAIYQTEDKSFFSNRLGKDYKKILIKNK